MCPKKRDNYKNLKIWQLGLEITNDISLGSSFDLGTQLLVAKHRKYINDKTLKQFEEKIEEFQRITMGFQNGLNNKVYFLFSFFSNL